jgi:dolichol-phosphate mannosyltransferase
MSAHAARRAAKESGHVNDWRKPQSLAAQAAVELTVVVPTYNERANVSELIRLLRTALAGVAWEAVFVDDDSPDRTWRLVKRISRLEPRVRAIRRVGRRGLAGAVIEGALSSSAPYVAVIDCDLQHDESLLPKMLEPLRAGGADLVIASRYLGEGEAAGGLSAMRQAGSRFANWLGRRILGQDVSDPVSGFFMVRRAVVEAAAPSLSVEGFKVLFDVMASSQARLRIIELPYVFRERRHGSSKLDGRAVMDYLTLLVAKASRDVLTPRALSFALVGASGLVVNLVAVWTLHQFGLSSPERFHIGWASLTAAVLAMTSNYVLNNAITYRDRRKRGWGFLFGYLKFCSVCSLGLLANVAVTVMIDNATGAWQWAGAAGAAVGAVWNYVVSTLAVW